MMSDDPVFPGNTDDAPAKDVLAAILYCARLWVPEARIIGNIRAGDIVRALSAFDPAELEAALKPFAKFADALKDEVSDKIALGLYAGGDIHFGPDSASVGDLRRAAALLAAITQEGRG